IETSLAGYHLCQFSAENILAGKAVPQQPRELPGRRQISIGRRLHCPARQHKSEPSSANCCFSRSRDTVCNIIHGLWVISQSSASSCRHSSSAAWFHDQRRSIASLISVSVSSTSAGKNPYN